MFKLLRVGFVGLVVSVATAWAGPSAIQGVVKDAKGQAIKDADVRIESRDGSKLFKTVKTDRNGRYVSGGPAAPTITVDPRGTAGNSVGSDGSLSPRCDHRGGV
jgi:hypothetical protein